MDDKPKSTEPPYRARVPLLKPLPTAGVPVPPPRPTIQPRPITSTSSPKTGVTPPPEMGPTEKVQSSFKQLSRAAVDLNAASDELGAAIKVWEKALKKLNLGVPAWVEISSGGERPYWWDRSIGYTKLKDAWGIALRTRSGIQDDDDDSVEVWAFNDAPRWMRIEGVGKLPDLLDALLKQAEDTTKKLTAKVTQANELATAISAIADELAALEQK